MTIVYSIIHSTILNLRRTGHSRSGLLTFLAELWGELEPHPLHDPLLTESSYPQHLASYHRRTEAPVFLRTVDSRFVIFPCCAALQTRWQAALFKASRSISLTPPSASLPLVNSKSRDEKPCDDTQCTHDGALY